MIEEYYLFTFESTHGAISTDTLLKPVGCTIMPVPRAISTSCGMAVRVTPEQLDEARRIFRDKSDLGSDEFAFYHIRHDKENKTFDFERVDI